MTISSGKSREIQGKFKFSSSFINELKNIGNFLKTLNPTFGSFESLGWHLADGEEFISSS